MTTETQLKEAVRASLDAEQVWREIARASFAIISHVTLAGAPRSSGVMYEMIGRHLFVAVDADGWKARHLAADPRVAVTVPVRRGGLLSLMTPIPPATISFHGTAVVHRPDAPEIARIAERLTRILPTEHQDAAAIVEIVPEGEFVTYGIGVSLMQMRDTERARGRVPVSNGGTP
jgi:hypothetical protein